VERISIRLRAGALVVVALAIVILAAGGSPPRATAASSDLLPDLVADPPANATLDYHTDSTNNSHDLLLRFDGYVHNAGAGPFEVQGSRPNSSTPMVPRQRVYQSGGGHRDDAMPPNTQLFYSNADGHNHWHLQDIARYSLWNKARSAEVAPALKVGFCLMDSQHMSSSPPANPVYDDQHGRNFCQYKLPNALTVFEGISAGWRDIYYRTLALQWVVVSDVQPGTYWLREDIDPDRVVHESNETNAPAWSAASVAIPGYVAKPLSPPAGKYGQAQQLTLASDVFGSPGARHFRVVSKPAHGSLSVAVGSDFTNPSVKYTPAPGYTGPDKFTYEAHDSTSPYPIHPQVATVALSVAGPALPSIVIDRIPPSLDVTHGVQLHATVRNDMPGVIWSVNGVDGGRARSGTITQHGFYTAPSKVPASGHVTIGARSASGAHDERVLKITVPRTPTPAPWGHAPKPKNGALLGRIATALQGHVLVAGVVPARAGVVTIRARIGKHHTLGSCHAKTPRGHDFTCRVNVPPGVGLDKLKLIATLRRHGKTVATVSRTGPPKRSR
jgi:hypothetical protein